MACTGIPNWYYTCVQRERAGNEVYVRREEVTFVGTKIKKCGVVQTRETSRPKTLALTQSMMTRTLLRVLKHMLR
jgi:hypothetical protein